MKQLEYYGTVGPACADADTLGAMFAAGMTGVRLNLSHGGLTMHGDWLDAIRLAAKSRGIVRPQLLIDLQGPELRIGSMARPMTLAEGQTVALGTAGIPLPPQVMEVLAPGMQLLLDDGRLLLRVKDAETAQVLRGGVLQSRKNLDIPGCTLQLPTLTEEDRRNLSLATACGVTGVMLPFVRGRADLITLRNALAGTDIRIYAKIENLEGVRNLESFLDLADMVVIARGDLGNAQPLYKLPRLQKELASACRMAGKPFMVVTQLLDSMTQNAVPTRAEVCDVYNAVLDGASALMLTGETAVGRYPVQAMEMLVQTAREALA